MTENREILSNPLTRYYIYAIMIIENKKLENRIRAKFGERFCKAENG